MTTMGLRSGMVRRWLRSGNSRIGRGIWEYSGTETLLITLVDRVAEYHGLWSQQKTRQQGWIEGVRLV